jgi:hypothetical protein
MSPKIRKLSFPPSDISRLRARFPAKAGYNEYDLFRSNTLPAFLLRYSDQLQWRPVGVIEFKYDKESYQVRHRFIVGTGDQRVMAKVDLLAASEMVSTPRGPRREWKLTTQGEPVRTHYLARLAEVETAALSALDYWLLEIRADHRSQALALLASPDDPLRLTEFNHLYQILRKDVPPLATAETARGEQPLILVKDVHIEPNGWRLTYHGDLSRNSFYDVECVITLATDNLEKDRSGWRIVECKYLSEHKKAGRMVMTPGGSFTP